VRQTPEEKRAKAREWHRKNLKRSHANGKRWRAANLEKVRAKNRERYRSNPGVRYGIVTGIPPRPRTLICPLCTRKARVLTFDHSHYSKKFRGWICGRCNTAIGMVNDSVKTLQAMIKYLELV
jgi:hypothetical protein